MDFLKIAFNISRVSGDRTSLPFLPGLNSDPTNHGLFPTAIVTFLFKTSINNARFNKNLQNKGLSITQIYKEKPYNLKSVKSHIKPFLCGSEKDKKKKSKVHAKQTKVKDKLRSMILLPGFLLLKRPALNSQYLGG